jgi:uncharacterized protein (DUF1778 family)
LDTKSPKRKTKSRQIQLKVSDDEYDAFNRAAKRTGRSMSGFIRFTALMGANEVNRKANSEGLDEGTKSP